MHGTTSPAHRDPRHAVVIIEIFIVASPDDAVDKDRASPAERFFEGFPERRGPSRISAAGLAPSELEVLHERDEVVLSARGAREHRQGRALPFPVAGGDFVLGGK